MRQKTILYLSFAFFLAVLLWGLYTLFYYLGVPVHGAVLLSDAAAARLGEFCDTSAETCRGLFAFLPFFFGTIQRLSPFLAYAVLSLVAYGVILGVRSWRGTRLQAPFTLRPWHVYGVFVLALTLIFTAISYGSIDTNTTSGVRQTPARQLVEPVRSVYRDSSEEALENLQRNFSRLQEAGCLTKTGQFTSQAGKYVVKTRCIYGSFISRVLSQVLFITVLLLTLLVTGRLALTLGRFRTDNLLAETVLSVCLGACLWVTFLWFMAVFGWLHAAVGWTVAALVLAAGYKQVRYWLTAFVHRSTTVNVPWYHISVVVFWLLLSYLALNFLSVVRPFPIGWDDLGSYLNRPRLMVSYGEFIHSMAMMQWEYLTSLGYLLFGYNSTFGATASMLINWMAGLLAVGVVFLFTNYFAGKGRGILAALLFYLLPLIGHFSFADMKIDNAVFVMGAISMFCLFVFLFPRLEDDEEWRPQWHWLALAGIFGGYAFGMKATAVMVIMTNAAILLGVLLHWTAFIGVMIASVFVFAFQGVLNVQRVFERMTGMGADFSTDQFLLIVIVLGVALLGLALYLSRKRFPLAGKSTGILVLATLIPIIIPVIHNNAARDWETIGLQFGAPNTLTPSLDLGRTRVEKAKTSDRPIVSLPPELAVDPNHEHCQPTGSTEELDRYWGFSEGWSHYLTLPWRTVHNLDSAGYYVTTMPGLLLFPALLLLPFFWFKQSRWLRWLFAGTLYLVLQWMFLANGIPWYGIGMFLGLMVGLEVMLAKAPDFPSRLVLGGLVVMWIFIMLNNRMWQFEMQRNIYEYPMGKVDAVTLEERTIPHYDDVADVVLERFHTMSDRPYLYRVGTFIPYFIPRNLEVIGISDHQLDKFNCIHQERDPELTTKRLKALGFNSIVFDTNTATIEDNPQGTLHQKVKVFTDYLSNPESGLRVVLNDPNAGIAFILIP